MRGLRAVVDVRQLPHGLIVHTLAARPVVQHRPQFNAFIRQHVQPRLIGPTAGIGSKLKILLVFQIAESAKRHEAELVDIAAFILRRDTQAETDDGVRAA